MYIHKMTTQKKYLLTFSNTNFSNMKRIKYHATQMNCFDDILTLNENDISDFVIKHQDFINKNPRGFGLWIWKPYIILNILSRLKENDILVYCDTGMYLNSNGIERFNYYVSKLNEDNHDIITFSLTNKYIAQQFVKMDAIMSYYPEFSKRNDKYCYAGIIMFKRTKKTLNLIVDWLKLCENYDFINTSKSKNYSESSNFFGNDCDNGLFNLCLAKHNISYYVNPEETNIYTPTGYQDYKCLNWLSLDKFPFQCRRIRYDKNNDTVSVIIPTYNRFKFILNAIDSIRNQTIDNIEIIIVNDASTQQEYYTYDFGKNVKIIHLEKNSREIYGQVSLGPVRNHGLKIAKGKYIAFLDDDDYWLPHKLEMQIHAMKVSGCKMSHTEGIIGIGPYDKTKNYPKLLTEFYVKNIATKYGYKDNTKFNGFPSIWDLNFAKIQNCMIGPSVIIEKSILEKINYMNHVPGKEDYDCWKRALEHTSSVYIYEPCVYYDNGHGDGQLWK
jgi:hypothetical protein